MQSRLLKINQGLLFFVLLTIVLYYGRQILVPLVFAAMLAMLMAPLCRKIEKKGFSRTLSCIICILILLVIMLLAFGIMMAQISGFIQDLPLFEMKINGLLNVGKNYVEERFDIPVEQQTAILKSEAKNVSRSLRTHFTRTLTASVRLIAGLAITLAFSFLMLFHKEKYYSFFLNLGRSNNLKEKEKMLNDIASVAQHYLTGRAISIIILFVLYVVCLLVIGIKGALLLAAIGALVNIVPYVGPLLAGVFPFVVALVTKDSIQPAMWVVITFSLIQAIDNYFVTPYVLGGEVSLSALATIVIIICGGFLWGIPGMILFIPMLSIAKIILDRVESLQPYGHLIGDQGKKPSARFSRWFKNLIGKAKST